MTPANIDREHNRELTDAELLAICGGTDTVSRVKKPANLGSEPTPID